jgi:hypothetical protein
VLLVGYAKSESKQWGFSKMDIRDSGLQQINIADIKRRFTSCLNPFSVVLYILVKKVKNNPACKV